MRGNVRYTGSAAVVALALCAVQVPAGQARTLTVDDNRAQCRSAGYTTIQAAVDAAAVNDTVQVCRGTYSEQVRILAAKRGLKLRGADSSPPRIVGPADPGEYPDPGNLAVIDTRAPDVRIRGFDISGVVDVDTCPDVAGIGVFQGSAAIDFAKIGPVSSPCGGHGLGVKVGTGASFTRAPMVKVDRSQITGFDGSGVLLAGNSVVEYGQVNTIQRTRISGPGPGAGL